MRNLDGRTAVITGASQGIGLYVARTLAAEGMNVVLAARSREPLEKAASEISCNGNKVIAVPTDVTDPNDLENLVEQSINHFGGIDVLVNNAGVETYYPFHLLDVEKIIDTLEINLTASLILSRLVLPHMLAAGRGHIVNMSSMSGKHGPAYGAAYGASKSGMIAFTQSLRAEYHGSGVSGSVICPGFTNSGGMYERMKQETGRTTPLHMGSTSADAVSRAVVKAIQKDLPEVIVNSPPMRPIMVLTQWFPKLGEWIVRKSTRRFLRKLANSRKQADDAA